MPLTGRKLTRKALAELYADIPPSRRKAFFRKAVALAEQCVDEASDANSLREKSEALRNSVQAVVMLGDVAAKALDKHEQIARIMSAVLGGTERPRIEIVDATGPEPSAEDGSPPSSKER